MLKQLWKISKESLINLFDKKKERKGKKILYDQYTL